MSRQYEFKMERRPYGDGVTMMFGITCGWCRTEAWHPARNGGWAQRVFKATGWKVGNKAEQSRCPTCFGKAKNAARRRPPDNPVLTKEQAAVLKARFKEVDDALPMSTKQDLLMTSVLVKDPITVWAPVDPPEKAAEAAGPAVDPIPPAEPPRPPTPLPAPPTAYPRAIRGQRGEPGVTVFPGRKHASMSGSRSTGGVDGREFLTLPLADGWTWKPIADTTPEEHDLWKQGRRNMVPRITAKRRRSEVQPPHPSQKGATVTNVTPIKKDPMTLETHIDTGRKLTREERGLIHDELTKTYDIATERYAGGDSDKAVAERLNVPRIGVTEVREMFFGAHDRNQTAVKQVAALDKAIADARAAAARLLEMAAEADTLERGLVAARKLLEGHL